CVVRWEPRSCRTPRALDRTTREHATERMNIHEYQAREILRRFGVPVPPGEVAATPEEAEAIAARYGQRVVIKAQVHAGGRGKAGGVKLADTPAEAREKAAAILGREIKGLTVNKVLVAPADEAAS